MLGHERAERHDIRDGKQRDEEPGEAEAERPGLAPTDEDGREQSCDDGDRGEDRRLERRRGGPHRALHVQVERHDQEAQVLNHDLRHRQEAEP